MIRKGSLRKKQREDKSPHLSERSELSSKPFARRAISCHPLLIQSCPSKESKQSCQKSKMIIITIACAYLPYCSMSLLNHPAPALKIAMAATVLSVTKDAVRPSNSGKILRRTKRINVYWVWTLKGWITNYGNPSGAVCGSIHSCAVV